MEVFQKKYDKLQYNTRLTRDPGFFFPKRGYEGSSRSATTPIEDLH
jgi:hypothetical protein